MAPTASPELVAKTLFLIMLITITTVISIATIAYFSYTYKTNIQKIVLGEVYVFDAFSKYKKTLMYAVVGLILVTLGIYYQRG
jgi:hypothetical protein